MINSSSGTSDSYALRAQLGRAICIACSVAKIGEQSAGIVRCALLLCRDSRKACAAAFAFEEGCYFFCIPGW